MTTIGILSDTHGYFLPRLEEIFKACDQIWHAGDIGDMEVIKKLEHLCPVRAVYGNIDGSPQRELYKETEVFTVEGLKVLMTHIGGYPGKYPATMKNLIRLHQPNLMVCGHSHILKVMNDKKNNLLHINPGAAGKFGFHQLITVVKIIINEDRVVEVEVAEFPKNQNPAQLSATALN
ncbi:MAG: metallophosphoesterase family protein [Bacteroidales bacterium]|nr:metallophosphoesterase family protein [Bacteroidales bacterium]